MIQIYRTRDKAVAEARHRNGQKGGRYVVVKVPDGYYAHNATFDGKPSGEIVNVCVDPWHGAAQSCSCSVWND
jgi:hypothetical protein